MTCPNCGQAVQGAERFCVNCGTDLTKPMSAPSAVPVSPSAAAPAFAECVPQAASPVAQPVAGELRGVGGWLLLFCIWITIVDPIYALRLLPFLRYIHLNWTLPLSLLLIGYGVVTGIHLWRGRVGALMLLRVYFGLMLALTLFSIGLLFYGTLGMHISIWSVFAWCRTFAFLGIWVTYFRVSKRVRATYGANL